MNDLKILIGIIKRHRAWTITFCSTAISVGGAIIARWLKYAPLPGQVAELEQKISAIVIPSNEALQWVGTLQGKWDNIYDVRFQVFYTYGNNYLVEYSYRDLPGKPLQSDGIAPGVLNGNILTFRGNIHIQRKSPTTAEVIGVFANSIGRSATLTKQQ